MILIFQIIAVFINILLFLITIRNLKYNLKIMYIVLLLFQLIFVFPIILEWIFGIQDYSYKFPGFDRALNDIATNICYSLFVIIVSISFFICGKKINVNKITILKDIRESLFNLKINRLLYVLFMILMYFPIILALLSPDPAKYFTEYAYFQKYSNFASESELWYHRNVLKIGGFISLISIVVVKLFSKKNFFSNLLIYIAAISTGILNGKRTLFALIIFAILSVDILKSSIGKFPYRKVFFSFIIIVSYFIAYAFIVDKFTKNVKFLDSLRLYFFRDIDVKFSIYALLNPEEYKILDFWGQSYLYNLLFYVPRQWWPNKPYPYDIYVTSSALGYPSGTVLPWNFQTSFFGEALSNLGWFGIPFSIMIINKFVRISERSNNSLIFILCIFIIMFSFMNHFGSYKNYLIIWIFIFFINKIKKNRINK